MADLRKRLFEAMRNDIGVMAEHNDSEASLMAELNSADQDILDAYADTFLEQEDQKHGKYYNDYCGVIEVRQRISGGGSHENSTICFVE